jgi:putative SOS response-associated peptidase YedK
MCGRLALHQTPALRRLFRQLGLVPPAPAFNVAPTAEVPVLAGSDAPQLRPMRWWMTPRWARDSKPGYAMFNARAENLEKSRAFRGPFHKQRCLVPAAGYYEWEWDEVSGKKQPWLVQPARAPLLLAGIWEHWQHGDETLDSFAIITTQADPELAWLHDRMPVMLPPDVLRRWLDPATPVEELLPLLGPRLPYPVTATPVSSRMNNARLHEPEAVQPVGEPKFFHLPEKVRRPAAQARRH